MTKSSKPQRTFEIGQIVYVLSDKAEAIVPAIVVEELVHKKLDGNSISWKVAVGPPSKKKIVASDDLSGEIYTSLDEIQKVMLKRLSSFVTDLVGKAHKRTESWYGKQVSKPKTEKTEVPGGKIDPAMLLDTIDGRENAAEFLEAPGQEISTAAARASLPPQQQPHSPQQQPDGSVRVRAPNPNQGPLRSAQDEDPNDPRSALRHRLRSMAEGPEQEGPGPGPVPQVETTSGEVLVMADGSRVPINYSTNE